MLLQSAVLLVVSTPLGNLGDLSPRAGEALGSADLILAEDTRRTGLLLKAAGIGPKKLLSLHEHNEEQRIQEVLAALESNKSAALVSDAGTPLMADPGYRLVRACRTKGYTVSPIPGPSAILAALSGSGLPPYPFTFLGFLPRKAGEKKKLFLQHGATSSTLVFFERKNRVVQSLQSAFEVLGDREFCLARELTKKHEQFINGRLGEDLHAFADLKGEMTIVLAPAAEGRMPVEEVERILRQVESGGESPRKIVRRMRAQCPGWSGKELYMLLQEIRKGDSTGSDG
ncbi:MAG: 16S rRNA (cytidine(1402)-2'-O)-methyltransferase [Desulfovibrionales bacterium]